MGQGERAHPVNYEEWWERRMNMARYQRIRQEEMNRAAARGVDPTEYWSEVASFLGTEEEEGGDASERSPEAG